MNILKEKELPYILTIFIALVGWSLQHSVTRMLSKPLLEYKVTQKEGVYNYEFTNLTSTKNFKSITIILKIINPSAEHSIWKVKPYSIHGAITPQIETPRVTESAYFPIKSMEPGFSVGLDCFVSHGTEIIPQIYSSDDTIYFKESNFETYVVKNEIFIFLWVAVIAFIIIFLHLLIK